MRGFFSLHLMKLAFLDDGISSAVVSAVVFFGCAGDLHYRASAYGSAASGGCSG